MEGNSSPLYPNGRIILLTARDEGAQQVFYDYVHRHLKNTPSIHFAKRYSTRRPKEGEEHFYLDHSLFEELVAKGHFISLWRRAGESCGVESFTPLCNTTTIAPVSRYSIGDFKHYFGNVITVEMVRKPLEQTTSAANHIYFPFTHSDHETCERFLSLMTRLSA